MDYGFAIYLFIVLGIASIYLLFCGIAVLRTRVMNWNVGRVLMGIFRPASFHLMMGSQPDLSSKGIIKMGITYIALGLILPLGFLSLWLSLQFQIELVPYFILGLLFLFFVAITVLPPLLTKNQ